MASLFGRGHVTQSHTPLAGEGGAWTPSGPALQTPPGLAVAAVAPSPETWILQSSTILQTSILTLSVILETKPCQSGARECPTLQNQVARVATSACTE